ncbi:hypothetical protein ACFL50_06490 [Candidatus Latescibacterota bacterium]
MGAFLGISLWIALATVIPGLVTIAVVCGSIVIINPELFTFFLSTETYNDWICASIAITIMVFTQALGILLEDFLVKNKLLGPKHLDINIPEGLDPHGETHVVIESYFEYEGMYILLAELRENEDTQGHLKRALAQFFLTNNTLISFLIGIAVTILLLISSLISNKGNFLIGNIYLFVQLSCLWISFKVARIRFKVMARALWATRRRRLHGMKS